MTARRPDRATLHRRTLLRWGCVAGTTLGAWPARGQGAVAASAQGAEGPEPPRLALLIGNRDYPDGEDLPPIHKNVQDLRAALERRGFQVSAAVDLSLARARQALGS